MAGSKVKVGRRGALIVYKEDTAESNAIHQPRLFHYIRPRYLRPSVITISLVPTHEKLQGSNSNKCPAVRNLAGSRDQAFRFLRSVIAQHSTCPKTESSQSAPGSRRGSRILEEREGGGMTAAEFLRASGRGSRPVNSPLMRPALQESSRTDSTSSAISTRSRSSVGGAIPEEKPVASGNGVSISVNLAEPVLFLQGYDNADSSHRSTAMLRGSLHLKVQKSAKIKAVTLKFKGTATTRWPEGIPPKKVEFEETDSLMSHTWPFFNAQFPTAEGGSCADHVRLASGPSHGTPYLNNSPVGSSLNVSVRDGKRLSLQTVQTRSFDKHDAKAAPTVAQRGYRTFHPGDYIYNFELPLDSRLPETIDVDLGFVKYELEATVERAGAFRANLTGLKPVTLIRAPTEGSLEQVEPIAISRTWEDQLHYDIVISGKSFPLGSKIPIAFKLTPLAKVQCHRIKVFLTENIEYFCSGKRVHRMEPVKKVLLFEKRADGTNMSTFPGSTQRVIAGGGIPYHQRDAAARGENVTPQDTSNLLGHLENEPNVGPTEMEFAVQLPGCQYSNEKERLNKLHFDTTYHNIQIHHWVKIVLRLSRPDTTEPSKRRHFEISIDSPFHILSCRASQANIALPAYTSPEDGPAGSNGLADCSCPGAPRRNSPNYIPTLQALNSPQSSVDSTSDSMSTSRTSSVSSEAPPITPIRPSLARPPTAHIGDHMARGHVQRPIHLLRTPSFNPPAFEAEEPPPPLVTPPPQYNDIASPTVGHGLADYFSRFESVYGEDDSDDERSSSSRSRVNVPLTPGGRVNRSMDLGRSREWPDVSAGSQ